MTTVFLIIRQWPGGRQDILEGWIDEVKARRSAGNFVGRDDPATAIALRTVDIKDLVDAPR